MSIVFSSQLQTQFPDRPMMSDQFSRHMAMILANNLVIDTCNQLSIVDQRKRNPTFLCQNPQLIMTASDARHWVSNTIIELNDTVVSDLLSYEQQIRFTIRALRSVEFDDV